MKLTKSLVVVCAMTAGATVAAADTTKSKMDAAVKSAVEAGQTAFFDMVDKESLTINFDKGSSTLTDSEKTSLRAAVTAARADAKIKRIIVAAWSDSDLPRNNDTKLSEAERKLADERAENIEKFLATLKVDNVDTYSMAENANWFQRIFKTDEAEIKKSMKGMVINEESDRILADRLSAKGGPSKAAVLIIDEKSYLSH